MCICKLTAGFTNFFTSWFLNEKCLYLPVTNAFWSCPLNPVAHGFTVATLLVLQRYMPMIEMRSNAVPPAIPVKILMWWLFDGELLGCGAGPGSGLGSGEGKAELFRSGDAGFSTIGGVAEADGEGAGEGDGAELSGRIAARLWGSSRSRVRRFCSRLRRPLLLWWICLQKRMTWELRLW